MEEGEIMFNLMEFIFNNGIMSDDKTRLFVAGVVKQYNVENIRKGYLPYNTGSGCSRMIDNSEYRESIHRDREAVL